MLPASPDVDLGNQTTEDMRCSWSGGDIERMEWLFLGQNTIVPMKITNSSWDGALLSCTPQETQYTVKGINELKTTPRTIN